MIAKLNYYQVIGVPEDVTPYDLKRKYHEEIRKYHQDLVGDNPENIQRAKDINVAYQTLSKPEKRAEYDGKLKEERIREEKLREGSKRSPYALYSSLYIFDNDEILLTGLKKAYMSEGDGEWRIPVTGNSERDWMKDQGYAYQIIRENGKVRVSTNIANWYLINQDEKVKKTRLFLSEDDISPYEGMEIKLKIQLNNDSGLRDAIAFIPKEYMRYISSLKSVAQKLAAFDRENKPIKLSNSELVYINDFTRRNEDRYIHDIARDVELNDIREMVASLEPKVEVNQYKKSEGEPTNGKFFILGNDLVLLAGLKMAYKSGEDGDWYIPVSEHENRSWMQGQRYEYVIRKREGKTAIYRNLADWTHNAGETPFSPVDATKEQIAVYFISENNILSLEGDSARLTFTSPEGKVFKNAKFPEGYTNYLAALKKVAQKLAEFEEGKITTINIGDELSLIKDYSIRSGKISDEIVRTIASKDIPSTIQNEESRIEMSQFKKAEKEPVNEQKQEMQKDLMREGPMSSVGSEGRLA